MTKKTPSEHPIIDPIAKRWSPRSFSEKKISDESLNSIFEAARWAASSGNEQPWEYYYGVRGTEGFDKLWHCLTGNNLPWTKKANILVAAVARTVRANQKPNGTALHDLGMANANMFIQAISMDIYTHPMAGFDKEKLKETLGLGEHHEPLCMIAMGYLDEADKLEEPFMTRELEPRKRKGISEFTKKI